MRTHKKRAARSRSERSFRKVGSKKKEIGTEMVPVGATPNVNNNPLPNHANINMIGEGDFQPQLLIGSEGTVVQLESELTDIPHVCLIGGKSESEEEDDDDSYEENIADLFGGARLGP
jgi:hypothetical protein